MSSITILVGPPGAGKTTWREKNAGAALVLSSDDLIEEQAAKDGVTYTVAFLQFDHGKVVPYFLQRIAEAVAEGRSIVIDRTNMTRRSYIRFLNAVPRSYTRHAIVFAFDRPTLNERLIARGLATGKYIPPEVVDGMIERYQDPSFVDFDTIATIAMT